MAGILHLVNLTCERSFQKHLAICRTDVGRSFVLSDASSPDGSEAAALLQAIRFLYDIRF